MHSIRHSSLLDHRHSGDSLVSPHIAYHITSHAASASHETDDSHTGLPDKTTRECSERPDPHLMDHAHMGPWDHAIIRTHRRGMPPSAV